MAYLHGRDKPLIHRDLGSKNVLLTKEGIVKIADFGLSKLLQNRSGSLMTTQPGTIAYMPPEALKKGGEYTAKVDSFSLGVLMLEICTQSLPSSGWEGINYVIEMIRREKDLSRLYDAHPLKPLVVWCLQHENLRPAVAVIHSHVNYVCEKIELQKENEALKDEKREAVNSLSDQLLTANQQIEQLDIIRAQKVEQVEALQEENEQMREEFDEKSEEFEFQKEAWLAHVKKLKEDNRQLEEQLQQTKEELEAALQQYRSKGDDQLMKDPAIEQAELEKRELSAYCEKLEEEKREAITKWNMLEKELSRVVKAQEIEREEMIPVLRHREEVNLLTDRLEKLAETLQAEREKGIDRDNEVKQLRQEKEQLKVRMNELESVGKPQEKGSEQRTLMHEEEVELLIEQLDEENEQTLLKDTVTSPEEEVKQLDQENESLEVYSKPTSKTESQDQIDHKSSTIPRRRSDLPKVSISHQQPICEDQTDNKSSTLPRGIRSHPTSVDLMVYSKPTSKTESQDQTDHKSSTIPRRRSDLPKNADMDELQSKLSKWRHAADTNITQSKGLSNRGSLSLEVVDEKEAKSELTKSLPRKASPQKHHAPPPVKPKPKPKT